MLRQREEVDLVEQLNKMNILSMLENVDRNDEQKATITSTGSVSRDFGEKVIAASGLSATL